MSQTASSQPRRRRGGRNRSHNQQGGRPQGQGRHHSDTETFKRSRRAPEFTFWEKLLGVFGLGPKAKFEASRQASAASRPAAAPPASSSRTTDLRSGANGGPRPERAENRPPREPRAPREPRPAVQHEIVSGRLYVGNLSYDVTEADLTTLFSGVGQVQSAEIVVNRATQRSKGFAFVEMLTLDEAKRAVAELHDKEYMGRKMLVTGAKPDSGPKEPQESREPRAPREFREPREPRPPRDDSAEPAARRERGFSSAGQPKPDVTTGIIRREAIESPKTDESA